MLAAQVVTQPPAPEPAGLCFRAKPAPACKSFTITSGGLSVGTGASASASPFRMMADWGAMLNVGRNAVGGSWFVKFDQDGASTGPVARFRRWVGTRAALDVAVGTPVASGTGFGSDGLLQPGSLLGMVKYSPVPYFGVALRPEYVRRQNFVCDTINCVEQITTGGRVYAGVEFDGMHGVITTLVLTLVVLLGFAAQTET
jgi:hypothetical protein